jgi:hypothetical protein
MPELKNYCPGTGVGRFDLELEGMRVKIKMKLHLVTALDGPTATQFVQRFGELVKENWEGKYAFMCDHPRYPDVYVPEFKITAVDNMMDSHFVLNILEGQGAELVSRDVYYKVPKTHTGFAPTSVNLFPQSVQPVNSSGLVLSSIKNSFPLYVDMVGTSPSDHAKNQVKLLGKQLAKLQPNIQVKVTAYGSNRTQKRNSVIQLLNHCGLTNVHVRHSKKPIWTTSRSRSTNNTNYVKITLGDTINLDVTNHPLFSYPTACVHEFGHMLGLQDEYACLSKLGSDKLLELQFIAATEQEQWENFHATGSTPPSEKPSRGQEYFINECYNAGVEPPHFGKHTISIMSAGSKFMPCHFVTIWAALNELTKVNGWKIVKQTRTN